VKTNGFVTTLAGNAGKSGDANGTGATARFNRPIGIAVDAVGNLYVADSENHTIRKGVPPPADTIAQLTIQYQILSTGRLRLLFRHSDGSLPADLSRLEVQWRTDLPNGTDTTWQSITSGFQVNNGFITFDDTSVSTQPRRFYRVLER